MTSDTSFSTQSQQANEPPFRYVHSVTFPGLLDRLESTLVVTTYQAGKLVLFRPREIKLSMLLRSFNQAMGVAVASNGMAIGTRDMIWFLRDDPKSAGEMEPAGRHDACFIPRWSHVTGDIRIHEIGWGGDELWIANTRFSCLCTLDPDYSFVPRWQPPFVTRLAAEDCCHLNGLAIADGRPKYVSVFAEADLPQGWRANKADGGCLIDVDSGETVARDLSMPHSPRVYDGRVWLLDSGRGRLVTVDPANGQVETVAQLPGYTRGLAFCGRYAFVGLSQIRETAVFGGVPIAGEDRKCGVWVIDIESGQEVAFLEFDKGVAEIFDVQIVSGIRFPAVVGLQKDTIHDTFVYPPTKEIS
ncbi:MAG: TIGR03032 family protein [Planctomycetes bacterium]|nr:TIGR03032 family protein [Planctomycetota bacterium]